MAKRLKLKKKVWVFLILIIFGFIAIYAGIKIHQNIVYKKTYEYKLINHGYSKKETQLLLSNFKTNKEREFFLNKEVNKNYINILNEKYCIHKNYFKYIEYLEKNPNKEIKDIIRIINIHRDQDFYKIKLPVNTSKNELMLVNKYYILENYTPEDLVYISQNYAWGDKNSKQIKKDCYDAFIDMWHGAKEDGYQLMINSAYRKHEDQENIYNNFKKKRGERYADSVAARPGASEHETGLALDIFSIKNSNKNTFKDTPEATWLKDNAYKYGFILRYPEGKENITGYSYESWHYRYVGKKAAKYCYDNDLTFDEYYAYFVEK